MCENEQEDYKQDESCAFWGKIPARTRKEIDFTKIHQSPH